MISLFKSPSLNCEKSQSHSHFLVTIYIDYRCSSLSIILRSIYFVNHSSKFSIYQELERPIWLLLLRTIFENTKNTKKVFSQTLLYSLNLVFFVFFRRKKKQKNWKSNMFESTMDFGPKTHYSIGPALAPAHYLIETPIRPKIACYIKVIRELIRRESPTSRLKSEVP